MWALGVLLAGLGIAAIAFGVDGVTASTSIRKGRSIFFAMLLFGLDMCVVPVSQIRQYLILPRLEAQGVILSTQTHYSGRGDYRSNVVLTLPSGGNLLLTADGRSDLFRKGERARVRYQAYSGQILDVQFLRDDGRPEGRFRNTLLLGPTLGLLLGGFLIFAAWHRRKRLPMGDPIGEVYE